mmetsp:Transcript_15003/g.37778  ORF Transcript_15003/g.37778 Transcript_15003/m.37778 type:complete len:150 (-) Transcript_15003:201-650(-)
MVNTTKTAAVEEDITEVVEDETEDEAITDLMESRKITTAWTMMTVAAVPREAEMITSKMKVVEIMDRSTGIEMAEETSETTEEGEEEDHTEEEVDTTKEAEVEDHGVGNSEEEIIAEAVAIVIATKRYTVQIMKKSFRLHATLRHTRIL